MPEITYDAIADTVVCCGSIALLTGALAHVISCRHMAPPPASLQAWEGLATQACIQLLEVCTSHPNQKKVYTAVVTKQLLLLLSQAIWQPSIPHNPSSFSAQPLHTDPSAASLYGGSAAQLTAAAKELLKAVIFHSGSIQGIIDLGTCFSNGSDDPSSAVAANACKTFALRSYHFQMLQVIFA